MKATKKQMVLGLWLKNEISTCLRKLNIKGLVRCTGISN